MKTIKLTKEEQKKEDNKNARITLIEALIANLQLQQKGKATFTDYCRDIASRFRAGEFTEEQILDLQYPHENPVIKTPEFLELITHLKVDATSGFTHAEAIEIGHKIQFIYLSYHQAQGRTDGTNLFRESMKPHEDGIDEIYKGTYDKNKLQVLLSLPTIENWDHKKAEQAYPLIFN